MKKPSFVFLFLLAISCSKQPTESQSIIDSTTDSGVQTPDAVEIIGEDTFNFNEEDYGDPGLEGMIVAPEALEVNVKDFLSKLMPSKIHQVIDGDFAISDPGPGVFPIYSFGSTVNDFVNIPGVNKLISDSTYTTTSTIYNWHGSRCDINESMPDGIYYSTADYSDFTFSTEYETSNETTEKLSQIQAKLRSKPGYQFIFKFTTNGTEWMLNVFTFVDEEKIYVALVDKTDCGA